jgi:hypothetical protein
MHTYRIRFLVTALMALTTAVVLMAAPQATLSNLKGKVEVKAAGASTWTPASEGMVLPILATVSTGFDSTVTIVVDKTTIAVKPLTRMTIDKLVQDQGKVTTSCYLRVGNAKASVKSAEGIKQDFKVGSPYSTASVRGTVFSFNGFDLSVEEGTVTFTPGRPQRDLDLPEGTPPPDLSGDFAGSPDNPSSPDGQRDIGAGNQANLQFGPNGQPLIDSSQDRGRLSDSSSVSTSLSSDFGRAGAGNGVTPNQGPSTTGSIILTWTRE